LQSGPCFRSSGSRSLQLAGHWGLRWRFAYGVFGGPTRLNSAENDSSPSLQAAMKDERPSWCSRCSSGQTPTAPVQGPGSQGPAMSIPCSHGPSRLHRGRAPVEDWSYARVGSKYLPSKSRCVSRPLHRITAFYANAVFSAHRRHGTRF
jgi:hypothetical protein